MIEIKISTLYDAIDKKTAIELRHTDTQDASAEVLFFSKFLDYSLEKGVITIDFPTISAALGALRKNDNVVVKFFYKDSPFIFQATVLDLNGPEQPESARKQMTISLPPVILGEERRNFLKVRTPPFDVTMTLIGSNDLIRQMRAGHYSALVLNISGGGIGLENPEKDLPFAPGDILDMRIHLPECTIHIEGTVLNIYRFNESGKKSFGIRFISQKMDKLSFNRSVKAIVHYVMRRERELLTK